MAEWVVLELTPQGEDEDPDILRASLKRSLKGSEIFLPISISKVGESQVVHRLMNGYVFVKREQPDHFYLKLEGSKYVNSVLTTPNGRSRKISPVRDVDIAKMQKQIVVETEQGIEIDDEVEIMSGAYKGIRGRVIEEIRENDSVQVYINLRSKQAIITLPRSFLRFVPAEDQSEVPAFAPFMTKVARTQELVKRAQLSLAALAMNVSALAGKLSLLETVRPWSVRVSQLVAEVMDLRHATEVVETPAVATGLLSKLKQVSLLRHYLGASAMVGGESRLQESEIPDPSPLARKANVVQNLAQVAQPLASLQRQVTAGKDLAQTPDPELSALQAQAKKVDLLHKAEFQGRAIKFQLSKLEATIRKAEENARSKRRR